MLDINLIRKNTAFVAAELAKKGVEVDFAEFLSDDEKRRNLIVEAEDLKSQRNRVSAEIPMLKQRGHDVSEKIAAMKAVGEKIKVLDETLSSLNAKQQTFLDALPNLPDSDVPVGDKEQNQVIKVYRDAPQFDFEPQCHVDLMENLGLIDYVRGAKVSGNGSWIYRGDGARLEWALLNYFVAKHLEDGYEMILPPHMLLDTCGYVSGQFPKFRDDVFAIQNPDGTRPMFMAPTAETVLVNLYRDEIIPEAELPFRMFAYTPCYRRESGSYRSEERGMIRGHQFNKVELFQYTLAENSPAAFAAMVEKATQLVVELGLHFRTSRLASKDISSAMRKTVDIEIWIPSIAIYKEVSSASSAGDYQARRGNIKAKRANGSLEFVHTLNASGLATSRVLPALIEQNQQADGSVVIPPVLRPWLGGQSILTKR